MYQENKIGIVMIKEDKIQIIKSIMIDYKPTHEEVNKLFNFIDHQSKRYQGQLKASTPTQSDRSVVYTI